MTPKAHTALQATLVALRGYEALRTGNPYHDAEGKFTSAGDTGHSVHHEKRRKRRRARRKAKLEALRKEYKGLARELKGEHAVDRRALTRGQRKEHADLLKEHTKERVSHKKDEVREFKGMAREHRRYRLRARREHAKDLAHAEKDEIESLNESHAEDLASLREDRRSEFKSKRGEFRDERKALKVQQREEFADLREGHREQRQELREQHKNDYRDLVESLKEEMRTEGMYRYGRKDPTEDRTPGELPRRRKGRGDGVSSSSARGFSGSGEGLRALGIDRQSPPTRTAKASSAESILRHCLRRRGWTAQWKRGELTGREQLDLLGDIREYARGWMRHEAEVMFAHHGRTERALGQAIAYHVGRFFGRAKSFVREAILAGALALSGPEPLTADDLAEVEQQAQAQHAYLDRFEREAHFRTPQEIAAEGTEAVNPMTGPQFTARAEQYGDAPWGAAQQVERRRMIAGGRYTEERAIHGMYVDDMCPVCRERVALGWQPIGTLRPIGDSDCRGSCHCFLIYKDAEGNQAKTVRPMRGRKPRLTRRPVVEA